MATKRIDLKRYLSVVAKSRPLMLQGKVTQVVGLVIEGYCPSAAVGTLCEIYPQNGEPIPAEVVGFRDNNTLLMPLGRTAWRGTWQSDFGTPSDGFSGCRPGSIGSRHRWVGRTD